MHCALYVFYEANKDGYYNYVNVGLSIQTHHILRHFLKILSMIHMPPKPIVSAGSDTI